MLNVLRLATFGLMFTLTSPATWGDDSETLDTSRTLVVGTKHSPPFAVKNADGQWTGISIELWRQLANELNFEYELRELSLDEMLVRLESGELDAAVAAISVTAERAQLVDFCHPHFTTGLGIAVPGARNVSNWTLLRRVVSTRLLLIVGVMIAICRSSPTDRRRRPSRRRSVRRSVTEVPCEH